LTFQRPVNLTYAGNLIINNEIKTLQVLSGFITNLYKLLD